MGRSGDSRSPYSQASVYTLELLGESHEDGANAAVGLLRERRLAYAFMADEQVREGALAATRDALFVWANVDAWDVEVAGAYARAVTQGCHALADVCAGMRDGLGRRLADALLDAVLVMTINTRLPWVSANKVAPALNPEDRPDELSPNATIGHVLEHLLARADIQPYAEVPSTALTPRTISRFDHGDARYFGLLFDDVEGACEVIFPDVAPTYDVRGGRYLGRVDRVSATLRLGEHAKVYAQLPYEVSALCATVEWSKTVGGRSLVIAGALFSGGALPVAAFHVIRAEIRSPGGRDAPWQRRNLPAPGGVLPGAFPWRSMPRPGGGASPCAMSPREGVAF